MGITLLSALAVVGWIADPQVAAEVALQPLKDASGNAITLNSSDGIIASAIVDTKSKVVWTYYWGTQGGNSAQDAVDAQIVELANPATVPAFADAVAFSSLVQARAAVAWPGYEYAVTGFSLGGTFAQWVGLQQNVIGVSFAGAGLPGYTRSYPQGQAAFISIAAYGDLFGQIGSDTTQKPSGADAGKAMDHYGLRLLTLGNPADTATLDQVETEYMTGQTVNQTALARVIAIHSPATYAADLMAIGLTN